MTATPVPWRRSADLFAQILSRHGLEPIAVTDVATAWRAFREFLQTEVEGLTPEPDADVDGFIVQWGRYSWHGRRLCVSFTRQLAVPGDCDCGDLHEQHDYWQVDLTLVFNDAAGLAVLDSGYESDTGFYFEPAGARRDAAITEAERYQQLQAALRATALHSTLSFERV